MRTLVVDDDIASRALLFYILSKRGECDTAESGSEALEQFCKAKVEGRPYDLVCLDIMMPEMTGQEVLTKIREYEEAWGIAGLSSVKIFMTTALGDAKNVMTSFKNQCEAYLVKPIKQDDVLARLREHSLA